IVGFRIIQLTSIPGKNGPPTPFSSAARSRPSGVIAGGAVGMEGGEVPSGLNLRAAHWANIAYWVRVRENKRLGFVRSAEPASGCSLSSQYSSPRPLGIWLQSAGLVESGSLIFLNTSVRRISFTVSGSPSSAQT